MKKTMEEDFYAEDAVEQLAEFLLKFEKFLEEEQNESNKNHRET